MESDQSEGDGGNDDGYEDRVAELESALEEREERIAELESRVKRVQADFENYKKRAEKKKEEFAKYATLDLVSELLEVKDDLERALESDGDLREGVELVDSKLEDVLEGEGVSRIETDGEVDPEKHEVMMQVESGEHDEGEIVDVYEQGYVMEGRVVRPAKVTVAKAQGDGDGSG